MSVGASPPGSLSQKKLNGIYWKTFVGFVKKENVNDNFENQQEMREKNTQLYRREGSFEYMELTTKDNASLQSETDMTSSSTDNTSIDVTKDDRSTSMYAVLNMNKKKEIQISDEIAIFEGSPIRSHPFTLPLSSDPYSPKCSPILHVGLLPDEALAPSPISGNCQRAVTLNNIDKDEILFTDKDDIPFEEDTFDSSDPNSPSLEPAPWKDQCLSIQRWMVPHVLPDNEDEFMALPDSVPAQDYDYCHYIPTLEAILEENEESADSRDDSKGYLPKSQSCNDNSKLEKSEIMKYGARWNSANDLFLSLAESQEDLYSTTSTCGSLRRVSTFENLSFDEETGDNTDNSSIEELDCSKEDDPVVKDNHRETLNDKHQAIDTNDKNFETDDVTPDISKVSNDVTVRKSQNNDGTNIEDWKVESSNDYKSNVPGSPAKLSSAQEILLEEKENIIKIKEDENFHSSSTEAHSDVLPPPDTLESSRAVLPASSVQSLLESENSSSGRGSPTMNSTSDAVNQDIQIRSRSSSSNVPRDSGVDDVISETANEITSSSSRTEIDVISQISSELSIPGLPEELYFDKRDIPKIVVMFAQEELAKERIRQLSDDDRSNGDVTPIQYRKRSSTYDQFGHHVPDSAYSSHEGVYRRISQIKASEASRLSTLSSSTPELSVMTEDALPYIPVSYASEAAAAKRKKKRRATIHSSEYANRKRTTARNNQTKTIIGGGGFGNGFNSLRKKFRNRNRIGTSLRRSQSEKPQVSRSSPDMSGPMARFLNSPRRRNLNRVNPEVSSKIEGRRRSFRSVVSNLFRRLGSRFSSQQQQQQNTSPGHSDDNENDVVNKKSPPQNTLDLIEEGGEENFRKESNSTYASALETPNSDYQRTSSPPKQRLNSALAPPGAFGDDEEFRQRSYSVPSRPKAKIPSRSRPSENSDVFESANSADDNSLDKTIYV